MIPFTETKYSFLDMKQREEFRGKWHQLKRMVDKWGNQIPGSTIKIFANEKTLEQEIIDLEDLSLSAYRAMKLLRKQLEDGSRDDYKIITLYAEKKSCSACNKDITHSRVTYFSNPDNTVFCSAKCRDSDSDGRVNCECGMNINITSKDWLNAHGRNFCNRHCLFDYEQENSI